MRYSKYLPIDNGNPYKSNLMPTITWEQYLWRVWLNHILPLKPGSQVLGNQPGGHMVGSHKKLRRRG